MCSKHSPIVILALLFIFSMSVSHADIPKVLNYQGKVTDTGGVPVADGDYSMTFTIYDAETAGTSLWSSGALTVSVSGGIFSVLLGDTGQPVLSLDFDEDYWVEVDIEEDVQSPRMRIGSCGYAFMASELVPGTEISGAIDTGSMTIFSVTNAAAAGYTYGIKGENASTWGTGIYGETTATSGSNFGVQGCNHSTAGGGVYGLAYATTGSPSGVYGLTQSSGGKGVYGYAYATTGSGRGVYGESNGPNGFGVYGFGGATSGANYGVYGRSDSPEGIGVYGIGTAVSGTNYGVYGGTNSPDGFAGYFSGRTRVAADLTVISGGCLGIGSDDPSNPLVVASPVSDTPGDSAQIKLNDSSNENRAFALRIGASGNNNLHLDSYYGGWRTLATIDRGSGRVGLGTDTPDRDLSVVGYIRASYDVDETEYTEMRHGGGNGFINWNGDGNFEIRYANDAKVTVQQDGKVGIGTEEPEARLDVRGAAVFNEDGVNSDFRIEGDTEEHLFFCDASEDKIGIGTENPVDELDIRSGALSFTKWNGDRRLRSFIYSNGVGVVRTFGDNGSDNVILSFSSSSPNNGATRIYDSSGNDQAGMYINSSGQGIVYGDMWSFSVVNPNQSDTEIWYASIESPEAATCLRGTARLENGRASISFPDHFKVVAIAEGMTIQLTPRSAKSEGLAVTEQSLEGFEVRELRNGTGNYEFHYTVMAVRDGYQDYKVIRPIEDDRLALLPE